MEKIAAKAQTELNKEGKTMSDSSDSFFREVDVEFLVHELKDPLAIIESNMKMLLKKENKYGPYSKQLDKVLKRSLRCSKKARDMIYGLLEVGRSQKGQFSMSKIKPEKFITYIIHETLELKAGYDYIDITDKTETEIKAHFKNHGIVYNFTDEVKQAEMYQDNIKIRQILANLLKNAFHYQNRQSEVDVKVLDNHLIVNVIDDGPGINPEHCDLIFERYAQINSDECEMKRSKHGLGLAAARIMARQLGGDINFLKGQSKGANFELNLPLWLNKP